MKLYQPSLARSTSQRFSASLWLDGAAISLIVLAALFVSLVNLHISYDDAFITYRYAYNLAIGQGFVYNPGEWYMGTTAPLYGLLLGGLGFIFGPTAIPTISGAISGASLALAGVALYVYGRQHQYILCGLLTGLFFVTNRMLPMTFGGEMLFQAALVLWAFVAYRANRTLVCAALLAIALLTRMDSALALGVIGLHFLATRRSLPWREGLTIACVLAPFALLSFVFYGSLFPATLGAKLAQRDSGLWPAFFFGLTEWIRGFTMQGSSSLFSTLPAAPNAIRFIFFAAAGIIAVPLLYRFWLLPLGWIALFVAAYSVLNVPFYHWYVVPATIGLAILAACGVAGTVEIALRVFRRVRPPHEQRWAQLAVSCLTLLALVPGLSAQLRQTQQVAGYGINPAEQLYDQTAQWLNANTPAGSSVGYFEIGRLGYFADRVIIDPLGLVDPAVAPHVAERDLTWAYRHYHPDYILYNDQFRGWYSSMLQADWFASVYQPVTILRVPGYDAKVVVYQRKAS